jgi:hypothetical protein
MTYIDLINRFWKIDLNYSFSHPEVHLYFKLLEIANRSGWRNKLSVPNSRLCGMVGLTQASLIKARQRLIDTDVIVYEKGTTRKAGKYIINPDYFNNYSNNDSNKTDCFNKNSNSDSNSDSNLDSNSDSNQSNLYKKRKDKDKEKSKDKEATEKIPFQKIKELFNEICVSQSKVTKITPQRKKHIKARWENLGSIDEWKKLFERIEASSFLRDSRDKPWMDFDWVIKNEMNLTKILEGKYDDKEVPNGGPGKSIRKADEADRFKNPAGTKRDPKQLEKMLVYNKG